MLKYRILIIENYAVFKFRLAINTRLGRDQPSALRAFATTFVTSSTAFINSCPAASMSQNHFNYFTTAEAIFVN